MSGVGFGARHESRGANVCFTQLAGRRVVVVASAITTSLAPAAANTPTIEGRGAAEGRAPEATAAQGRSACSMSSGGKTSARTCSEGGAR